MNIIKRLGRVVALARKSLSAPTDIERQLLGIRQAAAGITVTPRNALECVAVRTAVQVIAEAIGQLPVHTYKRSPDGSKERVGDHPAQSLINGVVNEYLPANEFREIVTRDALLWGNGYAFILREDGNPVELHRLDPSHVKVELTEDKLPLYIYDCDGQREEYAHSDVLHIRAPSFDGVVGDSPVYLARDAIALAMVMERHASTLFKNFGKPAGIISVPGELGDEAAARMAASWQASQGGDKAGGTAVLEGGASYATITMTAVDAQLIEMRRFAIEEIGRIYRVPPIFLGDYGRATWSNNESQGSQLVAYCLMAWIKRWQGELQLKLLNEDERHDFYFEFLIDDLLRADTAARYEAHSKGIAARFLSPNEVRAKENLPPYAGGDKYQNPNTISTPIPAPTPAKDTA